MSSNHVKVSHDDDAFARNKSVSFSNLVNSSTDPVIVIGAPPEDLLKVLSYSKRQVAINDKGYKASDASPKMLRDSASSAARDSASSAGAREYDDDDGEIVEESKFNSYKDRNAKSNANPEASANNLKKSASRAASFNSTGSSDRGGGGKEIPVTAGTIFNYMQWLIISFGLNIAYLACMIKLNTPSGLIFAGSVTTLKHAGPIIFEAISLLAFAFTSIALDSGAAALVGYFLTRDGGYSIAACGFCHSDMSTAKKFLERMSYIWLIHLLLLILTVFSSTGISSSQTLINGNDLMCIQYSQTPPFATRGIPSLDMVMGLAELSDGTAVGILASGLPFPLRVPTQHYFPSQLVDACIAGAGIVGPGYATTISSSCSCSQDSSVASLLNSGVPSSIVNDVSSGVAGLAGATGWVNGILVNNTIMTIHTIMVGLNTCGGTNGTSPSLSVCKTKIYNHTNAQIGVIFKGDGTTNYSTTAQTVTLKELNAPADINWLYNATVDILGGIVSSTLLPPHWPGSINPLLWTMSSNSQDVALALIEPGLEGAFAFVLRGAMPRSYTAAGSYCTQQTFDLTTTSFLITETGYSAGLVWSILQLCINFIALAMFVPWLLCKDPILPAVDIASDFLLFSLMSAKNPAIAGRMAKLSTNLEPALMWPKLDIILRVGESIDTLDDPDKGYLVMDRPKKVCAMKRDKLYE